MYYVSGNFTLNIFVICVNHKKLTPELYFATNNVIIERLLQSTQYNLVPPLTDCCSQMALTQSE